MSSTRYYVNVNRAVLAKNRKEGRDEPALSSRRGRSGKSCYGSEVLIHDALGNVVARVVQRPDRPLPCGATVYVECLYPTRACKRSGSKAVARG